MKICKSYALYGFLITILFPLSSFASSRYVPPSTYLVCKPIYVSGEVISLLVAIETTFSQKLSNKVEDKNNINFGISAVIADERTEYPDPRTEGLAWKDYLYVTEYVPGVNRFHSKYNFDRKTGKLSISNEKRFSCEAASRLPVHKRV